MCFATVALLSLNGHFFIRSTQTMRVCVFSSIVIPMTYIYILLYIEFYMPEIK